MTNRTIKHEIKLQKSVVVILVWAMAVALFFLTPAATYAATLCPDGTYVAGPGAS